MNKSILLCEPKYFEISYEINPWMDIDNGVNHQLAVEQWHNFHNKLKEFIQVELIDPRPDLPDMVFTANAGLPLLDSNKVVLSNFTHGVRKGEEVWFRKWFLENGFEVVDSDVNFEGAGDALYLKDQLITGYGFRSKYSALISRIGVKLLDPRFYHLDTCFCPLRDHYLIYEKAFSSESVLLLKNLNLGEPIPVDEDEALRFACNAVVVNNAVFIPNGCPKTVANLQQLNYDVFQFEMSEFMKSGGSCKCLTLQI